MTHKELMTWYIAYGEANGAVWDWERNQWAERET
jgi:hypothetical protein